MIVDLPSTTTAAVSKKLVRLRNDVGAMALGRVLTLLIIAGRNDLRAPARQVEAFVEKLASQKKDVSVRWFDAGHGSLAADEQIAEMREALAFLAKAAKPKAAPTPPSP